MEFVVAVHFVVSLSVPEQVEASPLSEGEVLSREDFFVWLWSSFGERGLVGVHEGTCLAGETPTAPDWTLDAAQAPLSRDWVSEQPVLEAVQLYFTSQEEAEAAQEELRAWAALQIQGIHEQADQDWDADWKASFLNAGEGVVVPPFWRILPPWSRPSELKERPLWINPGAGFGTGTHETTQLCLQLLGEVAPRLQSIKPVALDFGSRSGILSVALARLGFQVDAVEVDPLAIENARENAQLNEVQGLIQFSTQLQRNGTYSLIVANILKPTLLEFASDLVASLAPGGVLILSGLIETDLEAVVTAYQQQFLERGLSLSDSMPQQRSQGEWRALRFDTK